MRQTSGFSLLRAPAEVAIGGCCNIGLRCYVFKAMDCLNHNCRTGEEGECAIIEVPLPWMDMGRDSTIWRDHLTWLKANQPDLVRELFQKRTLTKHVTMVAWRAEARLRELRAQGLKRFLAMQQLYDELIEPPLQADGCKQEPLGDELDEAIHNWIFSWGTGAWDWTCE